MSRPIKQGLSYFPVDVDIFEDEKIQFVSAKYGALGEAITLRLLCKIYRNGYFLRFSNDDILLFAKNSGYSCHLSTIKEIIDELVMRNFFDLDLFVKHNILTSKGIQRRYNRICVESKRKNHEIDDMFNLIKQEPLYVKKQSKIVVIINP